MSRANVSDTSAIDQMKISNKQLSCSGRPYALQTNYFNSSLYLYECHSGQKYWAWIFKIFVFLLKNMYVCVYVYVQMYIGCSNFFYLFQVITISFNTEISEYTKIKIWNFIYQIYSLTNLLSDPGQFTV